MIVKNKKGSPPLLKPIGIVKESIKSKGIWAPIGLETYNIFLLYLSNQIHYQSQKGTFLSLLVSKSLQIKVNATSILILNLVTYTQLTK